MIDCLAKSISGCQFSCISSSWLCSIFFVCFPPRFCHCPEHLSAFWLLSLLKAEFHLHICWYLISNIYLPFSLSPLSSAPMIDPSQLENVLPACLYSPTYVVKDFPIARYQGLQFVSHLPFESEKDPSLRMCDDFFCVCVSVCERLSSY